MKRRHAQTRLAAGGLLLVMGLVGGLGGGMHLIAGGGLAHVRCWFACNSSAYGRESTAAIKEPSAGAADGESWSASKRAWPLKPCSICLMLATYRAGSVQKSLVTGASDAASFLSSGPPRQQRGLEFIECCRPRGPPSSGAAARA